MAKDLEKLEQIKAYHKMAEADIALKIKANDKIRRGTKTTGHCIDMEWFLDTFTKEKQEKDDLVDDIMAYIDNYS